MERHDNLLNRDGGVEFFDRVLGGIGRESSEDEDNYVVYEFSDVSIHGGESDPEVNYSGGDESGTEKSGGRLMLLESDDEFHSGADLLEEESEDEIILSTGLSMSNVDGGHDIAATDDVPKIIGGLVQGLM